MPFSRLRTNALSLTGAVCLIALLSFALPIWAQENTDKQKDKSEINLSLGATKNVTAKDVGLPIYPGARPHKDEGKDNSSAAQLWAWYNNSGFKLVVLKFESDDSPDKISAFYRKELARYGKVLDCSGPSQKANDTAKNSSHQLTCDGDETQMKSGHFQYKAGTKEEQHLVGIEPNGSGSVFHLLYVKSRSDD